MSESTHASGLADPEIYAQARLWSSLFEGDVGVRTSVYAVFGVKTPWGENNAKEGGVRLDEHVQPGTGSTDWFGGLSGSYQINPSSAVFASAQYRHTGTNDYDYRYGRIVLVNLAYEHKLTARLDGVVEVNYRHAGKDRIDDRAGSTQIPADQWPTSRRGCCSAPVAAGWCAPRRSCRCRSPGSTACSTRRKF